MRRLAAFICLFTLFISTSFGQLGTTDYQVAVDASSNYGTWNTGSNQGSGLGSWTLSNSGTSGHYIGGSGLGGSTFAVFAASAGDWAFAERNFGRDLLPGETFSVDVGHTSTINGEIFIQFLDGGTAVFTLKFVGGNSNWEINDGGSDFGAGQNYDDNTSISFSFTYEGGNLYSYTFGSGSGNNFTASSTISGIDAVKFQATNQGSGENFGFDNLEIRSRYDIPNGQTSTASSDITVPYLNVESGGVLTINSGISVTTAGDITNNGTINIENSGSLVQTAAADGNSGSGTYLVRRAKTHVDNTRFTYWSSPVASETMGDVFSTSNSSDFFYYDESVDVTSASPWVSQAAGAIMTSGKGYITTGDINGGTNFPDTYEFEGSSVNNGNIDLTTSYTLGTGVEGYILTGNPYPSTIDYTEFMATDNPNLDGTIWFWNHNTSQSGGQNSANDYATLNASGGVAASSGGVIPDDNNIPSMQGFFVKANGVNNVTVQYRNDQRVSGNNTQFFKGRTETRERMWLNALSSAGNNQILVAFVPEATDGLDALYDGKKLKGNPNFAFYSVLEDEDYAIHGLNTLLPEETKVIPLGIDLASPTEVRFELDSLDNWPNAYSAYLIDKEANAEHDLLTGRAYVVQLADSGSIRDRFELVVNRAPEAPSSVKEANEDRVRLWMSSQELFIQFAEDRGGVAQVDVFDLAGRAVYTSNQNQNRYTLNGLDNGTYAVRVTFADESTLAQTLVNMP